MAETIVFADAVAVVRTKLLAAGLTPVAFQIPNPRPASFIQLTRVGGTSRDHVVDDATVSVDCWAATQVAAMALAQQARAHIHAMASTVVGGVTVYRTAELAGPADVPDPESGAARVRQTFQIGLRATTE